MFNFIKQPKLFNMNNSTCIVITFILLIVVFNQLNYYTVNCIQFMPYEETNSVHNVHDNNNNDTQYSEHHSKHHGHSPDMWTILGQSVHNSNNRKIDNDNELSEFNDNHIYEYFYNKARGGAGHKRSRIATDTSSCAKCGARQEVMTKEQLTELRIEYVKNQILKKLKLKERPKISLDGLPRPVAEGVTFNMDNDDDEDEERMMTRSLDESHAKTTLKIIFPQLDSEQCKYVEDTGSSMCFSLNIPADIDYTDVESAVLWVYKQPHINMDKHSFLVGEIESWDSKRIVKPFAIQKTNVTEEWVKIDIAWRIQNWIKYNDLSHVIDISCNTCDRHPSFDLFSLDYNYRPFIVVRTHSNRKVRRQKRSVNCSPGVSECCREKLYISFAEIGWSDWILFPQGYHAYFCRGSCASAATITLSGSHHNSVLRKFMNKQNNSKGKSLELVPCCTATQFSPLQLFYMDSNNTATQKTLPNMVVEACGCM